MDPNFITRLLSQETDHDCYIVVGDPTIGDFERIGVISDMLMAHSLVFRSALNIQDSELDERWDVPVTCTEPQVFRTILKYFYGYRQLSNISFSGIVELLEAAIHLSISHLEEETTEIVNQSLSPANVNQVFRKPVCLSIQPIKEKVTAIMQSSMPSILEENRLALICAESVRHIISVRPDTFSETDLWKAVIAWARKKYGKYIHPMPNSMVKPGYIMPQLKLTNLCMLDLVRAVENQSENCLLESADDLINPIDLISMGHVVKNSDKKIVLCSKHGVKNKFKHMEFYVETIHNSSHTSEPMLLNSSEIYITTFDKPFELYSLVCSGRYPAVEVLEPLQTSDYLTLNGGTQVYRSKCQLKVKLFNTNTAEFDEVFILEFDQQVLSKEEFQIIFYTKDQSMNLDRNSQYKVELTFSSPHPMWKTILAEDVPSTSNISVRGVYNDQESGTHVKYVVYRDCF